MKKPLVSLLLGIGAGIIDVIPMIIQKLDAYSICSAFAQWILLGFIINYTVFGIKSWLKGIVIAFSSAIPIMILVAQTDLISIMPIAIMSILLGAIVGMLSAKLVKE